MELLNEQERERFRSLQARTDAGESLNETEQNEYADLVALILEREAQYLRPANERLLLEAERLQGQNEVLRRLISRNQRLADRLKEALIEAQAEQKAILTELRAALPEAESLHASFPH